MITEAVAGSIDGAGIIEEVHIALFLAWIVALAVAILGYYYWQCDLYRICGRGAHGKTGKLFAHHGLSCGQLPKIR